MLFKIYCLGLLFAPTALAACTQRSSNSTLARRDNVERCATHADQDRVKAAMEQLNKKFPPGGNLGQQSINVDVYFHVPYSEEVVPQANLNDQFATLRTDFAKTLNGNPTGISFNLKETLRYTGEDGAWREYPGNDNFKITTRKGGDFKALNVWFANNTGFLGECMYPVYDVDQHKNPLETDGCIILVRSINGISSGPYNLGKTLVHEVGHWMGLLHTFEFGCGIYGDWIEDTAWEADLHYGCEPRNSCPRDDPASGTTDPIHNYMDYSYDECMTEFTDGQAVMMRRQFEWYRAQG